MEYEKNICPVLKVDGVLAAGKQFDLDITIPEDNRTVIYGIVKDCYQEPVCNAVVKLIEVVCDCGKEERRPVSHTFTDESGEFVFGPLCANRFYEIEIWVDRVQHCKVCTKAEREGKCLKGVKLDCKNECKKPCHKDDYEDKCKEYKEYDDCKEHKCCKEDKDCKKEEYKKCEYKDDKCEKKCEDKCEKKCEDKYEDKCEKKCEDKYEDKCEKKYENKCERPMRPCFRPFN